MRNCLSFVSAAHSFRGAASTEISMDKATRQRSSEAFVKIMDMKKTVARYVGSKHGSKNVNLLCCVCVCASVVLM